MGAAIGTAIAPGIGTAIGAALGGGLGMIQGAQKVFELKDDNFKSYYQNLYNEIITGQQQSLSLGSVTAGARERDLQRLGTLIDTDELNGFFNNISWTPERFTPISAQIAHMFPEEDAAQLFQNALIEMGRAPPFSYDGLMQLSSNMLALGHSPGQVKERLNALSEAGAALNMGEDSVIGIAAVLDSAVAMGKVDNRLIRFLTREGISIKRAVAESFMNELSGEMLTEDDVMKVIEDLDVEDVVDAIYRFMGREFEGSVAKASETFVGLSSILDSYKVDMDAAMGEGYNEMRSRGMREQIDFFSGESGEQMKEAYAKIGKWEASLVNLQEQIERDMMNAVMTGIVPASISSDPETVKRIEEMAAQYAGLMASGTEEAGAEMGALLARAQALAANEYNASEGAQLMQETQLALVNSIRQDTALREGYYRFGYQMAEEFSRGMKEGIRFETITGVTPIHRKLLGRDDFFPLQSLNNTFSSGNNNAWGLDRVPYDNYHAVLHEGEQVLTAREARNRDTGGGAPQVIISGNEFHVRGEADIDMIASEIIRKIQQAHLLSV
jgi:hypothetical protein